ncbi:MAG: hypothetical protein GY915_08290, partial [bacterium]|nr:hypothetical protein [bacterium]
YGPKDWTLGYREIDLSFSIENKGACQALSGHTYPVGSIGHSRGKSQYLGQYGQGYKRSTACQRVDHSGKSASYYSYNYLCYFHGL